MITSQKDIFLLADSLSKDKKIPLDKVYEALESALGKIALTHFGQDYDIQTHIDRSNGTIHITRHRTVVENIEDSFKEISIKDIQSLNSNLLVGDVYIEELPWLDFGRIAAKHAKQVIIQSIKLAESERQYDDFIDLIGSLVTGTVKRIEFSDVILDVNGTEVILKRQDQIPREVYPRGQRIRVYILDVKKLTNSTQIIVTRSRPEFLKSLLQLEIPEIEQKVIEVVSIARDPGSRSKISLFSHDPNIDPVGATIGIRGSRIQNVINELGNEKIDIVHYSEDLAMYAIRALAPTPVVKVIVDEVNEKIELIVPDQSLSIAIGRKGQNVRLASKLIGWSIDIITETNEKLARQEEYRNVSMELMQALDVDEIIARLLVSEGFRSLDNVALANIEDLLSIEEFDQELAEEIFNRAKQAYDKKQEDLIKLLKEKKVSNDLIIFQSIPNEVKLLMFPYGMTNLKNFAEMTPEDFLDDIDIPYFTNLDREEFNHIILEARKQLGWIE